MSGLAIIGLALITHRTYTPTVTEPVTPPAVIAIAEPTPIPTGQRRWSIDVQCDHITASVNGYPEGSFGILTNGWIPPLHFYQDNYELDQVPQNWALWIHTPTDTTLLASGDGC